MSYGFTVFMSLKINLVSDKTGSNLGLFRPRERLANTYKMGPDETPLASDTGLRKNYFHGS